MKKNKTKERGKKGRTLEKTQILPYAYHFRK
jgi:hypothetical protein